FSVATVASDATHSFVAVHARERLIHDDPQVAFEVRGAVDTNIPCLLCQGERREHHKAHQPPAEAIVKNPHLPIWLPRHVSEHAHGGEIDHHENDSYLHPPNTTCSDEVLDEGEAKPRCTSQSEAQDAE